MRKIKHLLFILGYVFFLSICSGSAFAGVPDLSLQTMQSLYAGTIRDGTLLARGRINTTEGHCGFKIWSDAQLINGEPGNYLIRGESKSMNEIKFRIEGESWQPDTGEGHGVIINTAQPFATFNIVADGNQEIQPDNWRLLIHGAVTGCR